MQGTEMVNGDYGKLLSLDCKCFTEGERLLIVVHCLSSERGVAKYSQIRCRASNGEALLVERVTDIRFAQEVTKLVVEESN
mmetsp:Transcript_16062/g.20352  ORF Transcript_16062/g.20352 Transcript_16062/m.20352 type:complete len:81 (-) Transcript_16062:1880-2122(-)